MFELKKTEGKARRGEFTCAHGTVQTPVFMNVGTQGAIKGALSAEDQGGGCLFLFPYRRTQNLHGS